MHELIFLRKIDFDNYALKNLNKFSNEIRYKNIDKVIRKCCELKRRYVYAYNSMKIEIECNLIADNERFLLKE